VKKLAPNSRIEWLSGVGHLAHEERPGEMRDLILRLATEAGVEQAPPASEIATSHAL
jgi:hypothetical protein